jgi:hypothetical protein
MTEPRMLYVVACGCPLTRHVRRLLASATEEGWQSVIVATPDGLGWLPLDEDATADASTVDSVPVLSSHRRPDQAKRLPPPAAAVVLATANTLAKMRAGIADTYAHALLCEAISLRVPLIVVPVISTRLGGHPAYREAIDWLRSTGAMVVDPRDGNTEEWKPVDSGTGDDVAAHIEWTAILGLLPSE